MVEVGFDAPVPNKLAPKPVGCVASEAPCGLNDEPNAPPVVEPNAPPAVEPSVLPAVEPNALPVVEPNALPTVDPRLPSVVVVAPVGLKFELKPSEGLEGNGGMDV